MPFIDTDDRTRLFYQDWGTGRPVLLIHGWTLGSDIWEHQMLQMVAAGYRCIAYDRRGCGRSDQPGNGYDYDTLADDLASIIGALDLRGLTLVGHSMAGGEVVRYLTRHGADRVSRIAVVASTTPFPLRTNDNPDGVDPELYESMKAAVKHDRPAFMAASAPGFFGPNAAVSPEYRDWVVNLALQASLLATVETVTAFSRTDFREELKAITVPTLVVHGDADINVPLDLCAGRTAALIPGAQLKVYEGAPHGLIVTERQRLTRDLLAFMQDELAAAA